ncbi:MAG: tRNA methyltransferase [Rhizobium sp.]|nr:tRNA methyltransferase [Rhizobium sp.]
MSNLRIALYQPDIPGNTGTILRLAACLGLQVDIIEPAGFVPLRQEPENALAWTTSQVSPWTRHVNWDRLRRLASSPRGAASSLPPPRPPCPYTTFEYLPNDILLFGRESAGVPDDVHRPGRSPHHYQDGRRPALDQRRHVGCDDCRRSASPNRHLSPNFPEQTEIKAQSFCLD